jgi:hypothetical protein
MGTLADAMSAPRKCANGVNQHKKIQPKGAAGMMDAYLETVLTGIQLESGASGRL